MAGKEAGGGRGEGGRREAGGEGLGKNQSWKSPSHGYPILAHSELS